MRGSLVRARRASISSAGLQWACMSIMAVLLSLSSDGLTPKVPVCARLFANYRAIYSNRHSETSAFPHRCCWAGRVEQLPTERGRRPDEYDRSVALTLFKSAGLTKSEASEALTHLLFYAGWPNVFSAIPVAKDVFEKRPS